MPNGKLRTLYRGTNTSGLVMRGGIAPECLFAAADVETARLYGEHIEEIHVRPGAKILVEGTAEFSRVTKRRRGCLFRALRTGENLVSAASSAVSCAREAGYDAVEFTSMKDMGIAIINQDAFVRTNMTDAAGLSGRTVLLYHGCASFDEVLKNGLIFDRDRANDFGEGSYLASCGGTYFSNSLELAAFYAANAVMSEANLGGDPCVFAVEIDEALLIADEDKIWDGMRVIIEKLAGKRMRECELDRAEAIEVATSFLEEHGVEATRLIQDKFLLKGQFNNKAVQDGIRAFIVRAMSYEWNPADDDCSSDLDAINEFCSAASGTISRRWMSEHYDSYSVTCRTMHPVSSVDGDGPAKIVGHIRLQMDGSGLTVLAVDRSGVFDGEDAVEFEESFAEKVYDRSGCKIVGNYDTIKF
jgi:hypothetical protein